MPYASQLGGQGVAETGFHVFVLGLLVPAWFCFGKLAQKAGLPQITGYVIGGVLCGYSGLNLLEARAQQTLRVVDHACLAIIAFTAGAELHFDIIRRVYKQVTAITVWITIGTWASVYLMLTFMLAYVPFLSVMQPQKTTSIISLAAMLMVARSPASAIAVLKETGGKGPYCSLVLAVVVMKDVLVFVCFALNLEFVRVMDMSVSGGGMRVMQILHPFVSLGAAILLGFGTGVMLSNLATWRPIVFWRPFAPLAKRIPAVVGNRLKTVGVAGSAIFLFWLAETIDAEPLLACVMAGIVSANRVADSAGRGRQLAADYTAGLMVAVNATFFGLAGTSIRLGALLASLWVAICVWVARLVGISAGSWLGAYIGGTPAEYRRKVWQGMITQAGVAMGLAKTVATRFPTWGPDFATLMFAVILLNLCVGPPIFRHAIFTAGEANLRSSAIGILDQPQSSPLKVESKASQNLGSDDEDSK